MPKGEIVGEVIIDNRNIVDLESLGIQLLAIEDKIIIMMDGYKSGFECATCNGEGTITGCSLCNDLGMDRFGQKCRKCEGKGGLFISECPVCHGKGGILVIPERAKSLPTTGIVVSMGSKCSNGDAKITLGTRVIFNPHVGTLIPFKGNIQLKIMKISDPLAILYGSNSANKNFIDYEVQEF